jgi:nucleoside-diphosphate-sugar epimerase
MAISLVGYSGFIGQQLMRDYEKQIGNIYNSKNIHKLPDINHDTLIIAAPSAVKWQANKNPQDDLAKVSRLIEAVKASTANEVIHLSTCDIFDYSKGNRNFELDETFSDQPYSNHRRLLEDAVKGLNYRILRLPTVYGHGMKKNILFDLITRNYDYLDTVNPHNQLQWINVNLVQQMIRFVQTQDIKVLNCATQPITNQEVFDLFKYKSKNYVEKADVVYDMKTTYNHWNYLISKKDILEDMRVFINDKSGIITKSS